MSQKQIIMIGAVLGMAIGSYAPVLFGASLLGGWSVLGSMIGGFIGIWAAYKIAKRFS